MTVNTPIRKPLLLVPILLVIGIASALAQPGQGFQAMRSHMGAGELLDNPKVKEKLGLSDEQITTIKDGLDQGKRSKIELDAQMQLLQLDLKKAMDADTVDEKAVSEIAHKIGEIHGKHLEIHLKSRALIHNTLTKEQREKAKQGIQEKVQEWREKRTERSGDDRPGADGGRERGAAMRQDRGGERGPQGMQRGPQGMQRGPQGMQRGPQGMQRGPQGMPGGPAGFGRMRGPGAGPGMGMGYGPRSDAGVESYMEDFAMSPGFGPSAGPEFGPGDDLMLNFEPFDVALAPGFGPGFGHGGIGSGDPFGLYEEALPHPPLHPGFDPGAMPDEPAAPAPPAEMEGAEDSK